MMQTHLERFLCDLEAAIAYKGIGKNDGLSHTDLMFCARDIAEAVGSPRKLAVDLGTGRGQSACLLSLLADEVYTVDYRCKPSSVNTAKGLIERYSDTDRIEFYQTRSTDPGFIDHATEAKTRRVDLLFVDTLHTAEQVRHEIQIWFPLLADDAVVCFHDAVWCADTVTATVLQMATADTHRSLLHGPEMIDDWPGLGRVGVAEDGRPLRQSTDEIIDAVDQITFDVAEWQAPADFDPTVHDAAIALELRWPGMLVVRRGTKTWTDLAARVHA